MRKTMDYCANILLVDDEARNLDALETILENPGYRLVRAQTANEALMALLNDDFAVIVLDIQMPETNGFELARIIKQRRATQAIPIIFLTAYFQDEKDVLAGYDTGAVDYLSKPVNSQILKSKVAVFVDLHRKTRALAEMNATLAAEVVERQRAEKALADKNLELKNANVAKDRFLASISHELRTPLNAIIGFTGILLMHLPGPLNAEQDKQLSVIEGSANHLLSLINDILDLAKIESGKVEIVLEPMSCAELISDVADTLRPLAEQKGLEFRLDLPNDDPVIHTDRRALTQIVLNLTNNAIKYTEHGRITLALARRQQDGHAQSEISVSDTGSGIRPEDQARLFQAFTQLDSSGRRPEGTGLGLHLSQKLAGLLGGRIAFASDYGRGSTFTLALPDR
jgi:signal transduction histidine kinase